jgi:phenylacetate-coenzyme A ligase PaaK-like adenylate-forming protein
MGAVDQIEPIETASLEEIRALQLARLKATVRRAYERVPHYRETFDAVGVHPDDLRLLGDIAKFPFTAKDDLRKPERLIKAYVGLTARARIVPPGTIERSQGKAKRVIDLGPRT